MDHPALDRDLATPVPQVLEARLTVVHAQLIVVHAQRIAVHSQLHLMALLEAGEVKLEAT
jgi:hypothetical protein